MTLQGKKPEDYIDLMPVSTNPIIRLNKLYHETITEMTRPDRFIYEIGKHLNVSCDYLMGWREKKEPFTESTLPNPFVAENELARLIYKYCRENSYSMYNTNVVAGATGIDREIFSLIYKREPDAAYWITTSYHILSKLARTFGFNFYTVAAFCLGAEDSEAGLKEVNDFADRYNLEYGTNDNPNPSGR